MIRLKNLIEMWLETFSRTVDKSKYKFTCSHGYIWLWISIKSKFGEAKDHKRGVAKIGEESVEVLDPKSEIIVAAGMFFNLSNAVTLTPSDPDFFNKLAMMLEQHINRAEQDVTTI